MSLTKRRDGFEGQRLLVVPKKVISNFLKTDPVTKQVFITDIGYYPRASNHYVERSHGISQNILIYCTDGYGWLEVDHKRIEVSPSQLITIPANAPHRYAAHPDKPWTIYWVHFKGEIATFVVDLVLRNSKNARPYLSFSEDRIKLFQHICDNLEYGYSEDNLRYVNMAFSHFLTSLIYGEKLYKGDTDVEKDMITRTIEFMNSHVEQKFRLSEFSEFAQLSGSHFSAIFKIKTGYSPVEYFNQLKIQKACHYLSFTDHSIKAIAKNLGINDQYYFTRVFTRLTGNSPSEYRKKVRFANK
ncbi:MAG: AraC family transcriptional regulator [Sphingobacteriales bacterium]|nr:MAG: AraC family transcriptional regulator [Sphingobacteriales bacterium]